MITLKNKLGCVRVKLLIELDGWLSLGWWVNNLGMAGDHPGDGGWGLNFVSEVFVPNSKSVVHFILVDFGGGCSCSSCDRFKTKSTPLSSWTGVWQKKLCLNKKFVEKNVGTRKILLVIKNLWTQNSFIQKKFGSTKFWVRRYFKSKKIELKKVYVSKN